MLTENNISYQKVPLIATVVSIFLAIIKFIVGFITGSVMLLASAIDSLLDVGISFFNYISLKISSQPVDKTFNYGKGKIEAIAACIEGTVIFLSGGYIIFDSIHKFIYNETIKHLDLGMYVIVFSTFIVGILVWYLSYVYKKTGNMVIKSDLLHYKVDLITNIIIFMSLVIVYFTGISYIDFILGFLVGIYIMKEAFELIKQGINILLDKALTERNDIAKILDNFSKDGTIFSWHDLKTRKGGHFKFVEFHFLVDPNTTVKQAHEILDKIENQIKELDKNALWEVIGHADYKDDSKFKELKKN